MTEDEIILFECVRRAIFQFQLQMSVDKQPYPTSVTEMQKLALKWTTDSLSMTALDVRNMIARNEEMQKSNDASNNNRN